MTNLLDVIVLGVIKCLKDLGTKITWNEMSQLTL